MVTLLSRCTISDRAASGGAPVLPRGSGACARRARCLFSSAPCRMTAPTCAWWRLALATIGDPRAIPSLAAALGDPSRWTASNVASELIALGLDAVPTLQQIAWSGEPGEGGSHEAAVTAVRVLGDIRDPRAAPVLLHLLSGSSDLNMRARSAAA